MRNDNLYYLKTSEIIQAYKRKSLSPVYLIESYIKRAKVMNEKYNFITEFFEESAINLAKNAESLFAKNDKTIRPLEGIPLAVKDEFALDGTYRTSGSIIHKKRLDNFTDVYVQRLLNAGCIPIFKTTTPEFCLLGTTWSDLHGITTNPWNEKFTPGGSSGGSGVALSTGCATIATGSDIGGSIRIPASACGVFGFKPPYGRNPEVPYMNLDYYSHSGPMARSTEDIILMQNHTSGIHNQDIASLQKNMPFDYDINLNGLKIAWSDDFCGFEIENDVLKNLHNTLDILADLGAHLEKIDLNLPNEILEATEVYLNAIWGSALRNEVKGNEKYLTSYAKKYLDHSKERNLSDYINCNKVAWDTYSKFGPMIEKNDVFICPTNAVTGIPANHGYPNLKYEFNGKLKETKEDGDETMWLTTPFNMMSRLPVMSVPSGFASNNIPTGVQIVGKPYDDNSVFKVSLAYERFISGLFNENSRPITV